MKLIVGLGNPGREYALTRHNMGFRCLNRFARQHGIEFEHKRSRSLIGEGLVHGVKVILAKPQTYVNASGSAVQLLLQYYKMTAEDMIVAYDDMDLAPGSVRVRPRGRAAGHHGMESIIAAVQTDKFARVRMGIGHPPEEAEGRDDIIDHVLSTFSPDEAVVAEEVIRRAAEVLDVILAEGLEAAMNRFNRAEELDEKPADNGASPRGRSGNGLSR